MEQAVRDFKNALEDEINFFQAVRGALLSFNHLVGDKGITSSNFFNWIEINELKIQEISARKEEARARIASLLGISPQQLTISTLISFGYQEFIPLQSAVTSLSHEISYLVLSASVQLKHFSRLNHRLMGINRMLNGDGYNPSGQRTNTLHHNHFQQEG